MGAVLKYVKHDFPMRLKHRVPGMVEPDVPVGYTFHFIRNVYFYGNLRLEKRYYQRVENETGVYWIVCCRTEEGELESIGVGRTRSLASDICLYKLEYQVKKLRPNYFLPRNLVGYPNVIGHCYLISAVLPLMLCYPFLRVLLETQRKITLLKTKGVIKAREQGLNLVEPEYTWCQKLLDLHRTYYKVALKGDMVEYNMDILCSRVGHSNTPISKPNYAKPRGDLDLHTDLVKGLCTYLRSYCSGDYTDLGGDERVALKDILYKLASEDEIFVDKLFLSVKLTYTCRRCVGGPWTRCFKVPVLRTDATIELQRLLDRAELLGKHLSLSCQNESNLGVCGGSMRIIYRGEFLNDPEILIFVFDQNAERIELPMDLHLKFYEKYVTYRRLSSTNRFKCWLDKEGVEYGPHYREPLPDDRFDTWHTYPTIKCKSGYFDVNNGMIYKCNPELLNKSTPGTIHIYHKEIYEEHLPIKGQSNVYETNGFLIC